MNIPISSEDARTIPNTLTILQIQLIKERTERLRLTRIITEILGILYQKSPANSPERQILADCAQEVRSSLKELLEELDPDRVVELTQTETDLLTSGWSDEGGDSA